MLMQKRNKLHHYMFYILTIDGLWSDFQLGLSKPQLPCHSSPPRKRVHSPAPGSGVICRTTKFTERSLSSPPSLWRFS